MELLSHIPYTQIETESKREREPGATFVFSSNFRHFELAPNLDSIQPAQYLACDCHFHAQHSHTFIRLCSWIFKRTPLITRVPKFIRSPFVVRLSLFQELLVHPNKRMYFQLCYQQHSIRFQLCKSVVYLYPILSLILQYQTPFTPIVRRGIIHTEGYYIIHSHPPQILIYIQHKHTFKYSYWRRQIKLVASVPQQGHYNQ